MSNLAVIEPRGKSVLLDMSDRYGMEASAFEATLRATVVPNNCTKEQFAAFLLVAKEYKLNPILKEIYAFPSRNGIQPIVGVDGWANLINSHPAFDGMDFEDHFNDTGELVSITCRMHRKDRSHPVTATEYLAECKRATDPWKQWPRRMLRHKAMIQAARYAFSFAGIIDPDEAERFVGEFAQDVTPRPSLQDRLASPSPEASGFSQDHVISEIDGNKDSNSSETTRPPIPSQADKPASASDAVGAGNNSESAEGHQNGSGDDEVQAGMLGGMADLPSSLPPDWQDVYLNALSRATDRAKSLVNRHTEALTMLQAKPNASEVEWMTTAFRLVEQKLQGKITKAECDKQIAEIKDQ